jgi:DNA-binding NtrC family response regulator
MLLRVLGEGELVPVGETRARRVDVRVVAATSRDLPALVAAGRFRLDLYHRLRQLPLHVPALRERGNDWREILAARLGELEAEHRQARRFTPAALRALEQHSWPGNVRELRGVVDTGFHLSTGSTIEVDDIVDALDEPARSTPAPDDRARFSAVVEGEGSFWDLVYRPFMARELNRAEVRAVIRDGLDATRGSYKRLLPLFRMNANEYLRFMDFLRHHDLKPAAPAADEIAGQVGQARSSSIA